MEPVDGRNMEEHDMFDDIDHANTWLTVVGQIRGLVRVRHVRPGRQWLWLNQGPLVTMAA